MIKKEINLHIFNLATDLNSELLATAHDWISEFAIKCTSVTVYSTHVGEFNLPNNVKVYEIGGGRIFFKIIGFIKVLFYTMKICLKSNNNTYVFHHMSPRTAWIGGPIFRIFSIKQALWYSHYKNHLELRIATLLVNKIYSTAPSAFPIKNKKVNFIGHGINSSKFKCNFDSYRTGIVNVSRISRIKVVDQLLIAAAETKYAGVIELIGPVIDQEYLEEIKEFAAKNSLNLIISGSVNHLKLGQHLCERDIIYSNNLNTVDKSGIEGAIAGCFVISDSIDVQILTGMREIWQKLSSGKMNLEAQLRTLLSLSDSDKKDLRKKLSQMAEERNNISNLVDRIINGLINDENFEFKSIYNIS